MLGQLPSLVRLSLAQNRLSDEGLEGLLARPRLRFLDLSRNLVVQRPGDFFQAQARKTSCVLQVTHRRAAAGGDQLACEARQTPGA